MLLWAVLKVTGYKHTAWWFVATKVFHSYQFFHSGCLYQFNHFSATIFSILFVMFDLKGNYPRIAYGPYTRINCDLFKPQHWCRLSRHTRCVVGILSDDVHV